MTKKFALPAFVLALAVVTGASAASFAAPAANGMTAAPQSAVSVKPAEKTVAVTETTKKVTTHKRHHLVSMKKCNKANKIEKSEKSEKFEKTAKGEKAEKIATTKTATQMTKSTKK